MKEGFFGLNIAMRGLYTAQKNLSVISHNINNINTPGFSRQKAVQTAARPMSLFDGTGMIGTGSDVTSVERIRDEFLDYKYWSENVSLGEWSAKKELLEEIEVTFNEPSDSGFTTVLNEYFSTMQELSKDPSSAAIRSVLRQRGVTLAKYFNSAAAHFEKMQGDVNYRIRTKVEEVNSYAGQIQHLNRQIYISELNGDNANDLRDQRSLLVDKMSRIVNVEADEVVSGRLPNGKEDIHYVVSISGKPIVNHYQLTELEVTQRSTKLNEEDIEDLYQVQWSDGNSIKIKSGELKGYIDIRDGNNGSNASPLYMGIPYYQKKLNEFVRVFAMALNEGYLDSNTDKIIQPAEDGVGHSDGYRLDSITGDPPSGVRFFTRTDNAGQTMDSSAFINGAVSVADIQDCYESITARNIAVSKDIIEDYNAISASGAPGEVGNIEVLNSLLKMRHNSGMFSEGAPEDFMKSLVSILGIDSQQAVRFSENQEALVNQIDNRRLSVSGVSMDEEMADMVRFQHAYNAAAKMIATYGELYDTLINRTGL